MDPFIGEIRIFAGNFPPVGWAFCNGQLLSIAQNTALFSILGTTYGGDGKSNFALPNLQGSAPLGAGQGPGLSFYNLGQTGGERAVTLNSQQLAPHNHLLNCANSAGAQPSPTAGVFGAPGATRGLKAYSPTSANPAALDPTEVSPAGQSQPHNNMPPYLGLSFIIALQGVFPPRS